MFSPLVQPPTSHMTPQVLCGTSSIKGRSQGAGDVAQCGEILGLILIACSPAPLVLESEMRYYSGLGVVNGLKVRDIPGLESRAPGWE